MWFDWQNCSLIYYKDTSIDQSMILQFVFFQLYIMSISDCCYYQNKCFFSIIFYSSGDGETKQNKKRLSKQKLSHGPSTLKSISPALQKETLRSSRSQMFFKIAVFKNFTILSRKYLCWSFLLKACIFLKKETPAQVLSVNFAKFLRIAFVIQQLLFIIPFQSFMG